MIRVLVVDDSPTMRALLRARLNEQPDIEVVAVAADAHEARAMMKECDPDVVTLDIEMPHMNGLDFLERIMRLRPTPVIVVSDSTVKGAETTVRALELGAINCAPKRDQSGQLLTDGADSLAALIREASHVRFIDRPSTAAPARIASAPRGHTPELIAIGSSTGGIEALQVVLGSFPADCPPTVVVQHINPAFATAVARRLDAACAPTVVAAEPDMPLRPGHVYFAASSDRHLQIGGGSGRLFTKLRAGDPVSGHRPSVDVLFRSVAEYAPGKAVGVLLTGMGSDGAEGLLAMHRTGCFTIAQDQATSVVYGMPRAAVELGAASMVLGLSKIAGRVFQGRAAA